MAHERVVVALSGGVDSSVAAALLVEQGYDVIGLMLRLWSEVDDGSGPTNRCCALDAQYDAERVAQLLDIPFFLVNLSAEFKQRVVDHFEAEYAAGRTPNPCIECNRHIRFGLLLRRALALEADYLATGHYARVRYASDRYQLLRGLDPKKDQSYVLHVLGQSQLARVLLPLGKYAKTDVREMAQKRGLPVAQRPESQDLCFVADGDYGRFLAARRPETVHPGPICNRSGHILGEHPGLVHYTVGQRKGIGIASQEPLYVLALDPEKNALIVGTVDELGRDVCYAERVNWVAGEPPGRIFEATAKIRYKAHDCSVTITTLEKGAVRVQFRQPLRDITPGQAIVFYWDEVVLGGGTITHSEERTSHETHRDSR
jgi:tRNA-specific 2-thiouridylase